MGTYDYVNFDCPHCGEKVELQSKAFICNCIEFNKNAIPLSVAADFQQNLSEQNTVCKSCQGRFYFKINLSDVVEGSLVPIKNPKIGADGELELD